MKRFSEKTLIPKDPPIGNIYNGSMDDGQFILNYILDCKIFI
jgi:hypothetical protein